MKVIVHCLMAILPVLTGCAYHSRVMSRIAEVNSIEERHFRTEEPALSLRQKLEKLYRDKLRREIVPDRLRGLDDRSLGELFAAVAKTAFYVKSEPPTLSLEVVFQELVRRRVNTAKHDQQLYERLVVAGLFDKARLLAKEHAVADREPLPVIIEPADMAKRSHRVFDVSEDGKTLTVRSPDIGSDRRIIFVAHPTCSPSQRASALIESDPLLRCAFEAHAVVLNPPSALLKPSVIAEWNKVHPALKNHIVYSQTDWPGIEMSDTPAFYFLRNGKLVHETLGKPTPSETKTAIMEGLRSIGTTGCP